MCKCVLLCAHIPQFDWELGCSTIHVQSIPQLHLLHRSAINLIANDARCDDSENECTASCGERPITLFRCMASPHVFALDVGKWMFVGLPAGGGDLAFQHLAKLLFANVGHCHVGGSGVGRVLVVDAMARATSLSALWVHCSNNDASRVSSSCRHFPSRKCAPQ